MCPLIRARTLAVSGFALTLSLIAVSSALADQTSPGRALEGDLRHGAVNPSAPRSVFREYDDLAKAAVEGGSVEIEVFVNSYLLHTVAFNAGPSLRGRITTAETRFRNNTQRAIPYDDVVTAWNRLVSRYSGPSFMRTNRAQLALLEEILKRAVPHLSLLSNDAEGPDTKSISPVHASFLATFLATQKLTNGSYQMDADVWVKETRDYMEKATLLPGRTSPTDHPVRWHRPGAIGWMMSQTRSDSNLVTRIMHGFLDDLQVGRR